MLLIEENLIRTISQLKTRYNLLLEEQKLYINQAMSCTAAPEMVHLDNGKIEGFERVQSSKQIQDRMAQNVCIAVDLNDEIEETQRLLNNTIKQFRKCIQELPSNEQQVLHYSYIMGYSNEEIAFKLFYSLSRVKQLKHSGLINADNVYREIFINE